jgi:hypothetical protein
VGDGTRGKVGMAKRHDGEPTHVSRLERLFRTGELTADRRVEAVCADDAITPGPAAVGEVHGGAVHMVLEPDGLGTEGDRYVARRLQQPFV